MNLSRLSSTLLAASFMLAPTASFASENPGAHQHGHAELQLAIEGERVDLIFTSPAYNLLGFEHRARTGEQAALVTTTTHWLTTTPLVSTTSGGCSVAFGLVPPQAKPSEPIPTAITATKAHHPIPTSRLPRPWTVRAWMGLAPCRRRLPNVFRKLTNWTSNGSGREARVAPP